MRVISPRTSTSVAIILVALMPITVFAQFVPIQQAREQATATEQSAVSDVLTQIADRGTTARQQVQSILSDAASKRIGGSAAGRKIETIIGKLKSDLNAIITTYAKTNPPGNQLRAAYNSAQDTLNSIRRQSGEVLDQIGFDRAADPNKLSGKYLTYQNNLKDITAKGLTDADDRLTERGTKATIKKALDNLVLSVQQQIDISTTSFLTANTDVLPSAIDRIRKGVVDDFSKAMATRFKASDSLGSDKSLDLPDDELAQVQDVEKTITGIVDRTLQTIEGLMQQLASASLPTASNLPGQNPLLEAKFRINQQIKQLRDSAGTRIDSARSSFDKQTDVSQLAKDVLDKYADHEKSRLADTSKEYQVNLTAGDPTKQKYNKAKRSAQDEAAGCTDFLCNVGRVAATVGSGVLQASTGIGIQPKTFTTILGIQDGTGYATSRYTGGYGGATGGYGAGAAGYPSNLNQAVPFNTRCLGGAIPVVVPDSGKGLAVLGGLIGKAQAQSNDGGESAAGHASTATDSGAIQEQSAGISTTGAGTTTTTAKTSVNVNANQGFNLLRVLQSAAPLINQTVQTGGAYFGSCYGGTNGYGGLPGYGSYYNSPFGANPAGYQMGYNTNNLLLNPNTVNANNAAQLLAQGFGFLAVQPGSGDDATKYNNAARYLQQSANSGPITYAHLSQLRQILEGTSFQRVPDVNNNPIASLIVNMCSQLSNGNQSLTKLCKESFIPAATVTTAPTSGNGYPAPANPVTSASQAALSSLTGAISLMTTYKDATGALCDRSKPYVDGARRAELSIQSQYATNVLNDLSWISVGSKIQDFEKLYGLYKTNCPLSVLPSNPTIPVPVTPVNGAAPDASQAALQQCFVAFGEVLDFLTGCLAEQQKAQLYAAATGEGSSPDLSKDSYFVIKNSDTITSVDREFRIKYLSVNPSQYIQDVITLKPSKSYTTPTVQLGRYALYEHEVGLTSNAPKLYINVTASGACTVNIGQTVLANDIAFASGSCYSSESPLP